ncbi:hypothetical protein Tco_0128005 [Tanacetum coccineum]
MEQMTSICDMVGQIMQKKEEERRIVEEQAAKEDMSIEDMRHEQQLVDYKIKEITNDLGYKRFRGEKIDEEYEEDCEIRIRKLKQDFNEWGSKVRKKEQAYNEEQYVAARRRMLSIPFVDEDDYIPLGDIIARYSTSKTITPNLPIKEPDNSLSMGDEHLDTTPSIENLVPIPSEFEGTDISKITRKPSKNGQTRTRGTEERARAGSQREEEHVCRVISSSNKLIGPNPHGVVATLVVNQTNDGFQTVVNKKRNNKGKSAGNKIPKGVSVSKGFQVRKDFAFKPKTPSVNNNGGGTHGEASSKVGLSKHTNESTFTKKGTTNDRQQDRDVVDSGKMKMSNIATSNLFVALGEEEDAEKDSLVLMWLLFMILVRRFVAGGNGIIIGVLVLKVNTRADSKTLFCSLVYADNYYIDRRALWSNDWDEKQIKPWSLPELLLQLFNDSRTINEMLKQREEKRIEREQAANLAVQKEQEEQAAQSFTPY